MSELLIVLVTTPSLEVAEEIASDIVSNQLAACANIVPSINSIYTWEGSIQNDSEILLIIKTKKSLFTDFLIPAIKKKHPYEVPEIIGLPIVVGSKDYLDWIDASTQSS